MTAAAANIAPVTLVLVLTDIAVHTYIPYNSGGVIQIIPEQHHSIAIYCSAARQLSCTAGIFLQPTFDTLNHPRRVSVLDRSKDSKQYSSKLLDILSEAQRRSITSDSVWRPLDSQDISSKLLDIHSLVLSKGVNK